MRPVKVRPPGHDTDVRLVAELPAEHLPTATADRVQVGEPSPAYSNRRVGGSRRNAEVYVLDVTDVDSWPLTLLLGPGCRHVHRVLIV